ncbi:bacterio-opsin activator domain-containing protein [Halegenticoccus soli]|uniref:bacterio-opsin activator domain-containing protein n=1 Tax=Halegenticoccus soli TaxID=1985678 RepID=UPI000C6D8C3E|nr:bacterio-opsin activator domain-containing protein [Halegenticoccus soli]
MTRGNPFEDALSVFAETEDPFAPLTTTEVADALGCSRRTAYNRLERLVDRGELATKKVGARGRVWWRPPRGAGGPSRSGAGSDRRSRREELYRVTLENLTDTVLVTDDGGEFTFVCPNVHHIFGYAADEVRELGTVDALLGGDLFAPEELRNRGVIRNIERTVTDAEGDAHDLLITVKSVSIGEGTVLYACRDVTGRKRRERKLRRERELVEHIFAASPIGLGVVDADGRVVRANARAEEMIGASESESLGEWNVRDLDVRDADGAPLSDEDRPTHRALKTGEPVYDAELAVDGGGGRTWFSVNAAPLPARDGEPRRTIVVAEDVTERKERTRRLERQRDDLKRELDEAFERIDDAFFGLDERWRFTYVNERAERLLGKTEAELLDNRLGEEFPEAVGSTFHEEAERAMADQRPVTFEEYFPPLDAWFEVRVYPSETGLSVYFHDVTERKRRERQLDRQRERLAALNNLNGVVRDINEALVRQSTREEIERTVCERLAASDSYRFAWIAEVDPKERSIRPRVEAGVDGYLDEIPLSVESDDPTGRGPVGRTVRTRKTQVSQDVFADPDFEPWREYAEKYGYRSVAVVPITHEDALYGILGVYARRTAAFAGEEREVIGQLGEIIGHAITAIERKRALMSDDVVEVEFRLRDVFEPLDPPATDSRVAFDRTVPVGDGTYLMYGTATDEAMDALNALAERLPHWDELSVIRREFGEVSFELRLSEPPVISVVASYNGFIEDARIEDGDYHLTVHLPPSADAGSIIDAVRNAYPAVEMVTRRRVTRRSGSPNRIERAFAEELTDRQRTALEVAYRSGFFEWPRDCSGEEVADSLGVSPSTFHQHVRLGERKLVGTVFGDPSAG